MSQIQIINKYDSYQRMGSEWIELAKQYDVLKKERDNLALTMEKIMDNLIDLSKNNSALGGDFLLLKSECQGNVEYKSIPQLIGLNLDQYRKPSYFRWSLKKI